MTFGPAETECFGVVTDEHNTMTGVAWRRAEVALFNTHIFLNVVCVWLQIFFDECKLSDVQLVSVYFFHLAALLLRFAPLY